MTALYAPLIAMLLALVFRGVAFEFRWRASRKSLWDWAFAGGSMLATFAQGVALGALVQGIPVSDRAYAGGWWDWLTPFSILTGVALLVGYALLGATWLNLKTTGELQERARRFAWVAGLGTLALIGIVSLWTPLMNAQFMARWFAWPALLYTAPVPLVRGGCGLGAVSGAPSRAATPRRSWRRWHCSCSPTSASASASIPTSCRPRSPSGRGQRRTPA